MGEKHSSEAPHHLEEEGKGEDEEFLKNGWWAPDPKELQLEEEDKEYFIELLMGGSTARLP